MDLMFLNQLVYKWHISTEGDHSVPSNTYMCLVIGMRHVDGVWGWGSMRLVANEVYEPHHLYMYETLYIYIYMRYIRGQSFLYEAHHQGVH